MSDTQSKPNGGAPTPTPAPMLYILNTCCDPLKQGCAHTLIVPMAAYQSSRALAGSAHAATWRLAHLSVPSDGEAGAVGVPCLAFVCPPCAAACAEAQREAQARAAASAAAPKPVGNTVPLLDILGNRRPPR